MWIVQIIFWLQAFVAPVIAFGLIGLAAGSQRLFVPLLVIGGAMGVIVAEYIRRKIGLDTFFGRIYGPNEMDEQRKKKKPKPG